MTDRQGLRAVKAGEKVAPVKRRAPAVKTVKAAAKRSRKDGLIALRDRLGDAIDDPRTHPRDLANLARQQIAIAKDIEAIEASGGEGASGTRKTAVATTPNESWDESAV